MSVFVLSLLWVIFSLFSSVWFCQKCNLQRNIRDSLFLCGLQAQLILIYSVWWVFFSHMWVHVYCLDERESWWFSEMLVIILSRLFLYVTSFTREHQKFLPLLSPLTFPQHTVSLRSLSSLLKGFSHCSFIFFFTLFSCHSHSQLLTLNICIYFLVCIITASLSRRHFLLQVPAVLLSVLFFPSSSCPSPSAERWMDWISG